MIHINEMKAKRLQVNDLKQQLKLNQIINTLEKENFVKFTLNLLT